MKQKFKPFVSNRFMLKTYKYRLYPTVEQQELLDKHFGCTRLIYNLAFEAKQYAYKTYGVSFSYNDLASQLKDMKKEFTWLKEVNSQSLQSTIRNLDTAYQNFWRNRKKNGIQYTKKALRKKRLNPTYILSVKDEKGFPNFKSKLSKQSFQCPQNVSVEFRSKIISLPKFREGIRVVLHRKFKGEVKTVTINKTPSDKYFASVLVDNNKDVPNKKTVIKNTAIGIDLGIKNFATLSTGEKIGNPKYLKESIDKLRYLQRSLSRKKKDSNRCDKARLKVARQYEKISNKRNDFLHKVSDVITKQYDTICIEDLNIKGMLAKCKPKQDEEGKYLPNGQSAKRGLNQSISDVSWSNFVTMLEYKCEWRGKNLLKIGRFEPSTKMCNNCGNINQFLTLTDREWMCVSCGTFHDRDENAAINIQVIALNNWRAEYPCQDAEVLDYEAVEASKVLNNILALP